MFFNRKKRLLFYYPLLLCCFFRSFVGPILHSDLNHKSPGTKENEKINKSKQKKMKTRGRMWLFIIASFPDLFDSSSSPLCSFVRRFFFLWKSISAFQKQQWLRSDLELIYVKSQCKKNGIGNCLQTTSIKTFDCY